MKNFIFLLLILMPLIVFGQKAKIEFQETSYNFGTIGERNGKVAHEFIFINTGKSPLILTNIHTGCGCTTPEWSRQPIAPGDKGKIKVSFDPRARPGAFVKSISVHSNAENSVVTLTIRGKVQQKAKGPYDDYHTEVGLVKMISNTLNFGSVSNNLQLEQTMGIVNTGEKTVRITVNSQSPAITASVNPETLRKGQKGKIIISYDAAKRNDWGFVTDAVEVKVDDKASTTLTVTASIREDFSRYNGHFEKAPLALFSETEAILKDLPKQSNRMHDFYIQNNGKEDLIIRKIKTSDNDLSVTIGKNTIKPGKKAKVTVNFKTGDTPQIVRIIQFTLNDPQHTLVSYKITGNIK